MGAGEAPVLVSDIGHAEDAAQIQQNVVRVNGQRSVYIPVPKQGSANTIAVVDGVKRLRSVAEMQKSFSSFGFGLAMAVVLLYLVMVAQFRSFLDPVIIMFAVPMGMIGVMWTLYLTNTTLNIESFMGIIVMVGIVVSNSILLVDF